MTTQTASYSLSDLPFILPVTNSQLMLKWLKELYQTALAAQMYGLKNTMIISTDTFSISSDEFVKQIDEVHGRISKDCAKLLVDIVNSGALPSKFHQPERTICSDFLNYAYSA